ncbi:RHS repeat-associated core domain-containing protein, partial [Streptomyces zingiberis]
AGHIRYEHDAQGRITLRQKKRPSRTPDTWHYHWDAEDRLTAVVTPDGTHWRYRYDPFGRRTAKQRLTPDGTTAEETLFTWDGTTLAEQTTTSPDLPHPVTLTWDHDGLRPIAQTERITAAGAPQHVIDTRFFAIITDLVGTPTELVDTTGDIAWHTRTTLWGTTTWPRHSTTYTPLRFPGQYHDPETGLHHNYYRHYDPETARYTSIDPLGLTPAPNPATYVHNPHVAVDPEGLAPKCLNGLGVHGKDANGNFLAGTAEGQKLGDDIRVRSAQSVFTPDGRLAEQVVGESDLIIPGRLLDNPHVISHLTVDGSSMADWGKYSTPTHQSPYGDFQVHFYHNVKTGEIAFDSDYKSVMNRR